MAATGVLALLLISIISSLFIFISPSILDKLHCNIHGSVLTVKLRADQQLKLYNIRLEVGSITTFGARLKLSIVARRGFCFTRLPTSKWNKHGYISLAIPGHDPPINITIYTDIATNPGPNSITTSDQEINLHCNTDANSSNSPRLYYSSSQLKSLRKSSNLPSSPTIDLLKKLKLFRFRGKRAGKKRITILSSSKKLNDHANLLWPESAYCSTNNSLCSRQLFASSASIHQQPTVIANSCKQTKGRNLKNLRIIKPSETYIKYSYTRFALWNARSIIKNSTFIYDLMITKKIDML